MLWRRVENKGTCVAEALDLMANYTSIKTHGVPLWPGFTAERCAESRAWLEDHIRSASQPLVIVTHHAPVLATFNPRFEGDISDASFHNHWPELFRPPVAIWIHGLNHWCHEKAVNDIPVVTNQRGYPGENVPNFSWDRMIEVLP